MISKKSTHTCILLHKTHNGISIHFSRNDLYARFDMEMNITMCALICESLLYALLIGPSDYKIFNKIKPTVFYIDSYSSRRSILQMIE